MNELLKRYYEKPIGEQVAPYLAARNAVRHSTPAFHLPRFNFKPAHDTSYPQQACEATS
ncbi:MAG TPA: hypothetical protein VK026_09975 [Paenalcaligenes sp.]|nr:hypothetical protein [Paenalcaligenes sp.]